MPLPSPPNQTIVVHSIALLDAPKLNAHPLALVSAGTELHPIATINGFLQVAHGEIERGYIPAAACMPLARGASGTPQETQVVQAVSLYNAPTPGQHYITHPGPERRNWLLNTKEHLLILGHDGAFALIQRNTGQIGYLPAILCGLESLNDSILPLGPIDLGWLILGASWFIPNCIGIWFILAGLRVAATSIMPTAGGIALAAGGSLWLCSARRTKARSFAIGMGIMWGIISIISTRF